MLHDSLQIGLGRLGAVSPVPEEAVGSKDPWDFLASRDSSPHTESKVGGCILHHSMQNSNYYTMYVQLMLLSPSIPSPLRCSLAFRPTVQHTETPPPHPSTSATPVAPALPPLRTWPHTPHLTAWWPERGESAGESHRSQHLPLARLHQPQRV